VHFDSGRAQDDRAERIRSVVGGCHLGMKEGRPGSAQKKKKTRFICAFT
jgi:hypothetical protein